MLAETCDPIEWKVIELIYLDSKYYVENCYQWVTVMFGSDERYSDSSNDRRKPIPQYRKTPEQSIKKNRSKVLKTPEQSIGNTKAQYLNGFA